MEDNPLIISLCILIVLLLAVVMYLCITPKDEGNFTKEGEFQINNSNFKIVKISEDKSKVYNDTITIELNTKLTRIGWNKEYIVIYKDVDNYCIIDINKNESIENLNSEEFKQIADELNIKKIKLRTIGRYTIQNT